jgi:hypothetical protein
MCALVFIGILLHASSRVYEASLQVNNIVASPVNGHIDVVHGAELSMNRVAASMITSVKDVHIRLRSACQDQLTLLPARVLLEPLQAWELKTWLAR